MDDSEASARISLDVPKGAVWWNHLHTVGLAIHEMFSHLLADFVLGSLSLLLWILVSFSMILSLDYVL